MREFSPSSTEKYLTCPRLWDVSRRWQPRVGDDPARDASMWIGTAIHAGMAAKLQPGVPAPIPDSVAYQSLQDALRRVWVENEGMTLDGAIAIAEKALSRALKAIPEVLGGGQVVAVEHEVGNRRMDLVTREPEGLVITDWKYVKRLERQYLADRAAEAHISWQLYDYAHVAAQEWGEPVAACQMVLIVGAPSAYVHVERVPLDSAKMREWLYDALKVWGDMEKYEGMYTPTLGSRAPRNLRACLNRSLHYGARRCPFYDGCHGLDGDESQFATIFDERVRT